METRRDVFQAIADPTRREIIDVLARQSMNLNTVASHFSISRPAISKQIKILEECGLVTVQKKGRERWCEANLEALSEVAQWSARYLAFWIERLDALENTLEEDKNSKV